MTAVQRPSVAGDIRDLYKRIRILEALNPGCCGFNETFPTYLECTLANGGANLWALWPMYDAIASSTAEDIVNGRDLTVHTSAGFPDFGAAGPFAGLPAQTAIESGPAGGAAYLDYAFAAGEFDALFTNTGIFTIECWVYPLAASGSAFILACDPSAGPGNRIGFGYDAATLPFFKISTSTTLTGTAIGLNVWTHLRVTSDGTDQRLYQNGALVVTQPLTAVPTTPSTQLLILNEIAFGSTPNARIADLALYTAEITDFCDPQGGGGGPNLAQYLVPTTDGAGGWSWEYPTIEVTYT